MKRLSSLIRADREFVGFLSAMKDALAAKESLPIAVNGLTGGAEVAFLAESIIEQHKYTRAPAIVLVGSETERERLCASLCNMGVRALGYKKRELVFHNIRASHDIERERLAVLSAVTAGECDAVVTTPSAALSYTVPEELLLNLTVSIEAGDIIAPAELVDRLVTLGFVRVDTVDGRGQFAARGGIVDFFDGECESPVRIEFFGDEVDRLVYFDPISQRALSPCESARLLPACEVMLSADARRRISDTVASLIKNAKSDAAREKLKKEEAILESGLSVDFRDKYLGLVYDKHENLLSYFSTYKRCVVFSVGTNGCEEDIEKHINKENDEREALLSEGVVTKEAAVYSGSKAEYEDFLKSNLTVYENSFAGGVGSLKLSGLFGFRCRRCVSYGGNQTMLHEDLINFRKALYKTVIVTENKQGAESLVASLAEADIAALPIYDKEDFDVLSAEGGRIFVTVGTSEGFDLITPKVAVISMAKDEGRAVMSNRKRQRIMREAGGAKRILSYADLTPGDYVVHANYGIGLFEGIQTVTTYGITKDYITIRYAGTDKLFVPCDRLEQIGKYIGSREKDGTVKLSKMGGADWHRTKTKAKAAAKDIAKDLIALYAERQRKPGFAFPEDSELEYAFADAFEYEETESQTAAIREIKADMQRPVPMNRLLCGDVGFGKTEVALRAAFKAIMGGKQVALLVPTTILALQHYQTAISRMRGFPVTVEMLTRFKKPKEQAEILRKVKRGETDILIGTHKLLSKSLEFRDLGLLIIDEEQRFGVAQKEKLKEFSKNVDVLTLTATPIPRTLNMAMNGISDISVLDEAPSDRRPVQTYVLEHDDEIVFDAITRELARGGQVLYLYNKVEDIHLVADKLVKRLPDARVGYAHGQMEREELEDIWQMLVRGELDILVCTTIIETGVDLPAANTLVIENADRFGLSQLHQIRGRVGRSERQAYAYFTYRPGKVLSEIAQKRLSAIKEYAEFGAGFKIALCDLEIRGAGNLLGAQQHGYIDSVGYDLYVKLLNEAVLEERGEKKENKVETLIDIKVNAHIPESYVSTSAHRMDMYKKISLITSPEDEMDIMDEFLDRFGDIPKPVHRLLAVATAKAIGESSGISRISVEGTNVVFVVQKPDLATWSVVFEKFKGMRFAPDGSRVIYRCVQSEVALLIGDIMRYYHDVQVGRGE